MTTSWHCLAPDMRLCDSTVVNGRAIGIVGLYGAGKVLLCDRLEKRYREKGDIIVRVSFKELPKPSNRDVYHAFQKAIAKASGFEYPKPIEGDFAFHFYLQEFVQSVQNAHVILLLEEAQELLDLPDSFFDALESLRYRNEPKVSFFLTGQPKIRVRTNTGLLRLLKDTMYYLHMLPFSAMDELIKREEARLGIPLSLWKKQIYTLSGGYYGTVKYIGQLIKQYKFKGARLTESRVVDWAESQANFLYFIKLIWDSLFDDERLLIKELLETGTVASERQKTLGFRELIQLGIIRKRCTSISFFIPMGKSAFLRVIHSAQVASVNVPNTHIAMADDKVYFFGNNADSLLTYQERRVLAEFIKRQGDTVSYEDLGTIMWGEHSERFSMWSIAKLIERLRKKLSSVGISPHRISNVSGRGYVYRA